MDFEEIKSLRPLFNKYLNYKGINLWMISEYLVYNYIKENPPDSLKKNIKNIFAKNLLKKNNFYKQKFMRKTSSSKKGVIMIAYNPVHVSTFLPIFKKLKNAKMIKYDFPFSGLRTKNILEKEKIPYEDFDSYVDKNIVANIKKAEKWLDSQWIKMKGDKTLRESLGENYLVIFDMLYYFMKSRKKFLEIIRFIEILNKIYDSEKNKLVIVGEYLNPIGRGALITARERGIKSLVIHHGLIFGDPSSDETTPSFNEAIADKTTVSGQREVDFILSKGISKNRVVATGQPRFDFMTERNKKEACKILGLNPNKKIIVFAAQYLLRGDKTIPNAAREFLETVRKIKNKSDYEIIIKIHPGGDEKYLGKIDKKLGIKVVKEIDLYLLLSCCDILITASSMVAIEAVLLNRPVITLEIGGKYNPTNYEKDGVGISINKKGELLRAIDKILYNKNFKKKFIASRKKFIKDFSYKLDGKAAERTINIIEEMLN